MRLSPSSWQALRELSHDLGFLDLGAAPADALASARARTWPGMAASAGLSEWISAGLHGEMDYLEHTVSEREDPRLWWPKARTMLVGLVPYDGPGEPGEGEAATGSRAKISRYAWGRDYHLVVKKMLMALGRRLQAEVPGADWRTCVDRGAAMEKPWATLAGLGWIGKHGNLLRTDASSWFFIGLLATDVEIDASEPFTAEHCGTCTACIESCPTGAILSPQHLDARRCISYLTIELSTAAPDELRQGSGAWVHGCDACQDACPWNRHRTRTGHPKFAEGPLGRAPFVRDLLRLDEQGYAQMTPRSPLKRERRAGLLRNAAIAAGNSGDDSLAPELVALLKDSEPLVRGHAAWALGRIGGRAAKAALESARGDDSAFVRDEVEEALLRQP